MSEPDAAVWRAYVEALVRSIPALQKIARRGGGRALAPSIKKAFRLEDLGHLQFLGLSTERTDLPLETAVALAMSEAVLAAQVIMWREVARLLGAKREALTPDQVERVLTFFYADFAANCLLPLLKNSTRDSRLRSTEELLAEINNLRARYWSELPDLRGRRSSPTGRGAQELPDSLFFAIPELAKRLRSIKNDVLRAYKRCFGITRWSAISARLVDHKRFDSTVDKVARLAFEEFLPLEMLADPQLHALIGRVVRQEPMRGAVTMLAEVARSVYGYSGSDRALADEERRRRRSRARNPKR